MNENRQKHEQLLLEKKPRGEGCESDGGEPKRLRPDEDEEASQAKANTSGWRRSWSWSGSFLDGILFDKLHGEICEFEEEEEPKRLRPDENEESSQEKAKMSSVEGGRLFEVEQKQPEKKRHGEGCESEEEQSKQPRPEDNDQDLDMESAYDDDEVSDNDIDFSEGDSDGDDCTTVLKNADVGWWYRDAAIPTYWLEDGRRCHDVCHMSLHKPKFQGQLLFELFKVRLIRNQKFSSTTSLDGPLSGELALFGPSGSNFVYSYYRVISPDTFMRSFPKIGVIPHILRKMIGDPDVDRFLVVTYFGVYHGAKATVRVEIFNKDVSSCSGFIHARPCVFSSRIRLLSIQKDQKLQNLEGSRSVKLTRSVVAVPSNSSLIIAAKLYEQAGKEIVFGKTFFPASENGSTSKFIEDKDGIPSSVKVTVDWTINIR